MKWRTRTSAYSEQVSESIPSHCTNRIDYIRSKLRAVEPTKTRWMVMRHVMTVTMSTRMLMV